MVKFGRHQKFFREEHPDTYVVPYNDAKTNIEENSISETDFEAQWHVYLEHARAEFDASLQQIWRHVFQTLARRDIDEGRGAPPEKALVLFAQHAGGEEVQEILAAFKRLHAIALVNAEALRKLVKKFDKQHKGSSVLMEEDPSGETKSDHQLVQASISLSCMSLSCKLLPEVYAANFVVGLTALQQGTEILRSELGIGDYVHPTETQSAAAAASQPTKAPSNGGFMPSPRLSSQHPFESYENIGMTLDEDPISLIPKAENQQRKTPENNLPTPTNTEQESHEPEKTFTMLTKNDRKDSHTEHMAMVDRRRQELAWLKQSIKRLDDLQMLPHLVAHRGFHSPQDRSDKRPMENSLQAYESAWTSGIHLCECDIALTKDEYLILAHDEDFSRLALDFNCEKSQRHVHDLTFSEIMSVALKSGCRPPLLLDVLQSAHAIGGKAQLIIEIKPGNRDAASAVARMFGQHPHLMKHCAVVMSFDSFVMHSLQDEMDVMFGPIPSNNNSGNGNNDSTNALGHRRTISMGILPVPSATALVDGTLPPRGTKYPRPKLLVLTVSDEPNREVELQVSISEQGAALEKIQGWIKGRLDGVYMQFEPQMVNTPEAVQTLKQLASRYRIGIWGYNGRDPDHYDTFSNLVQEGQVSFVNTDLPRDFFKPVG